MGMLHNLSNQRAHSLRFFFDKLLHVYKDFDVRPLLNHKISLHCGFILAIIIFQLTVLTPVSAESLWRLKTSEWKLTNFDIMDVDPDEILSGGGQARAYPLQILIYHEIVNDKVGGKAVTVTFCPLCNASIVFDSDVEGATLDFGTTGRLRNSDLIMYDRQTESWWQQFTGKGIIGDYTGTRLQQLPSQIISFAIFRDAFADGKVLSKETGYTRRYGHNPYSGYDAIDNNPFLYRGDLDPRLPPMERVLSIPIASGYQLVPLSNLEKEPLITIQSGKTPVVVFALSTAASALDDGSIANSRDVPAAAAFQ